MSKLKSYTIRQGDTLQSISQLVFGDSSQWSRIAILNNLDYPFVVDDKTPYGKYNVKVPGETILLPSAISDEDTRDTLNSDAVDLSFGTDLKIEDGDLVVGLDGDLEMVSGLECLHQDLKNALATEYGTLPYHPTYGSKVTAIVGSKSSRFWLDQANVEIARTFKNDPRVLDVKDVSVNQVGTAVYINSTVVTTATDLDINQTL